MSRIVESLYGKYNLNEEINIDNDDIVEATLQWSVDKDELEAGIKELEQNGIKVLNIDQPDEDWLDFDIDIQGKKSVICDMLIKDYGSKEDAEEFYPELFDDYLNEARNPENDEVNAILKNKIGKAKLTKKEQEILDKYGITRNEYGEWVGPNGKTMWKGSGKSVYGPYAPGKHSKSRTWELGTERGYPKNKQHKNSYDEVDFANYLTKEPTDSEYTETDRGDWEAYNKNFAKRHREYATSDMRKANRPYSDDYKRAKEHRDHNQKWADREAKNIMSDDEIEKMVNDYREKLKKRQELDSKDMHEYQQTADENQKEIDDIIARAKAKHHKNENLNEAAVIINSGDDYYNYIWNSLYSTIKNDILQNYQLFFKK